jgi:hypothetical protein
MSLARRRATPGPDVVTDQWHGRWFIPGNQMAVTPVGFGSTVTSDGRSDSPAADAGSGGTRCWIARHAPFFSLVIGDGSGSTPGTLTMPGGVVLPVVGGAVLGEAVLGEAVVGRALVGAAALPHAASDVSAAAATASDRTERRRGSVMAVRRVLLAGGSVGSLA